MGNRTPPALLSGGGLDFDLEGITLEGATDPFDQGGLLRIRIPQYHAWTAGRLPHLGGNHVAGIEPASTMRTQLVTASCRNCGLNIFPTAVRGMTSITRTARGTAARSLISRRQCMSSSGSVADAPGRSCT